jgi:hypothetical protein
MSDGDRRWLTPQNVVTAWLMLVVTAVLAFLLWNQIDMQRHPATFDLPPAVPSTRKVP